MTRKFAGLIILALASLLCAAQSVAAAEADKARESSDLQKVIDRAEPGSTILLEEGVYYGPLRIDKTLRLAPKGTGRVRIVNESEDPAIHITADDVSLEGLTVRDELMKAQPSILIAGDRVALDSLQIETGSYGIMIRDADDGLVRDTTIMWAGQAVGRAIKLSEKGNGIDLYNAHRHRFERNTIADMHDGIYLENSDENVVIGNHFERSRYGVHCMYTKGTIIQGNAGIFNVTGAMVMAVRDVELSGNTFEKQRENVHSQGILLFDAVNVNVTDNRVEGNRVGIYVEQSEENVIHGNEVTGNFIGIQLLDASRNEIRQNTFSGNVADAEAKNSEQNVVYGNYWDTFQGIDLDGDGRSNLTYAINPFFQGLIKKRPAFQIFFQAPGMVFMEGLYQADRQAWMTDESPLMQPVAASTARESHSGMATLMIGLALLVLSSFTLYYAGVRK